MSNTLYRYFSKCPKTTGDQYGNRDEAKVEERLQQPADEEVSQNNPGHINDVDETEKVIEKVSPEIKTGKRKRMALVSSDEESDKDYKPNRSGISGNVSDVEDVCLRVRKPKEKVSPEIKKGKRKRMTLLSSDEPKRSGSSGNLSDMEEECLVNRKLPKKTKSTQPKPKVSMKEAEHSPSPGVSDTTKNRLSAFAAPSVETSPVVCTDGDKVWPHLNYEFLKPGKRKDLAGHLESHPDFNPKTLYLPESFKRNLTPALSQWWEMKSQHFDVVLFFKLGKFYELYHMDAVIGFKELNLMSMKGDVAHCGFPERSYGHYSQMLIQGGYRVARIEQTETPAMMEERCKKSSSKTKYDKVVKREICQITTKGTQRYSILDGVVNDQENKYLLAVKEKFVLGQCGGERQYGVCFVDTSIGKFHLGQFKDDRHGSHFCTLLAHYTPVQVLYEKGALSVESQQIMKSYLNNALLDALAPNTEFWSAKKTLKHLAENKYFCEDSIKDGSVEWPEAIKACLDEYDSLGTTAKKECSLAIEALGACIWYLSDCCVDQELISMKNFVRYDPAYKVMATDKKAVAELGDIETRKHMVLDAITLCNLDVVENSSLGNTEGTLYAALDQCRTPFGKRLLKRWLCTPLCDPGAIMDRQDAVLDLLQHFHHFVLEASDIMKTLPDLERLLSKIHAQGSALRSKNHPDSRAIFFDENLYSKRKICDFLSTLKGFETAVTVIELFEKSGITFRSKLLKTCVTKQGSGGNFPILNKVLKYFEDAFDHDQAKKDGKIIPSPGVDEDYDNAVTEKAVLEKRLEKYLKEQCQHFGCKVVYFGSGKNRYQLEVAEGAAKRAGDEYELQTCRKGYKRYWTKTTKQYLASMIAIEDDQDAALRGIMRSIFATFAKDLPKWNSAIECLSVLDVLMCFAHYTQNVQSPFCTPEILYPSGDITPFIEIRDGRYPCITSTRGGDDFIPNNTVMGFAGENDSAADKACLVIVTGPNMGGKSTLMRQVGLIVIMAQLGCCVPAEKCRLTPVDRLFTRLGASDRIMSGESTFFVESNETSSILQHATRHSLVLMDELGRGTATHDGTAIAYGVLKELADNIGCRTLFSTHYYSLVEDFKDDCNVKLGHMACMVDKEDEGEPSQETITFLYKFVAGACPKSYGFNAARLAGIPDEIIQMGIAKAKEMEMAAVNIKMFRKLCRL